MATNPQASDLNRGSVLRALPRRIFQQSWTKNLFARMGVIIAENALNGEAKRNSRWGVRRILTYAESDGLNSEHEITPAWLAGFPPKNKERHREYVDRAHVARLLQNLGLWSQENLRLFEENLSASTAQLDGQRATIVSPRKPISSPPNELCNLVRHLAHNCGLSTRELRWLHVTDIQSDGLRIRPARAHRIPARVIPFGSGWDLVSKPLLDTYGSAQEPKECLFFSRSPRDKKKSISRQTLEAAIAKLGGDTITALREQHFREDFNRARSPLEARFHLRNVHGLSNVHVHTLIASFANEAVTVPMPASYPLVALCASRSIPEGKAKVTIPEGGERYVITWSDLLGYEITVDWKRSFATDLGKRGHTHVRVLRLLLRVAFDFWFAGRRMKLRDVDDSELPAQDKDLLQQLAATRVIVRDTVSPQTCWAGSLFEYGTRKRSFRVPLIEEMNRRAWHNQCLVCWHPDRESIEREISEAATKETRVKGYHKIAEEYGVSYISMARHSGRVAPPKGRGDSQRNHFSIGPMAPIVHCQRRLWDQLGGLSQTELMIYSVIMLSQSGRGPLGRNVSTEGIEQQIGLRIDESQLSIVLNHLGVMGAGLIRDFKKEPGTVFQVTL